jgi:hypothetical protein
MEGRGGDRNRLRFEKSPYLLQHADNPVDWYPWGDEAFSKAAEQDKPIFLSIGYSTCHWCHVMEEESFQDPEVARLLNESFICIKVDREEHPDVDQHYMAVCQLITGTGGWPLNVFVTPQKEAFLAATYLPKHSMQGRPGLMELAERVSRLWMENRDSLVASAHGIVELLHSLHPVPGAQTPSQSVLQGAYEDLRFSFDRKYAGFGKSRKFPTPHHSLFLLRYWARTREPKALQMVERTLTAMRLGGIFDQVGHGFHRYTIDRRWHVPHFEKMLYDQAMMTLAYLEAYHATGKPFYARTARETLGYVTDELTDPEGGFYTAQDADTEEGEGSFYLWTHDEITEHLDPESAKLVTRLFCVHPQGNYRDEVTDQLTGRNVLRRLEPLSRTAATMGVEPHLLADRVERARLRLKERRAERPAPATDDKILTDMNGLAIAAFARVGRVLKEQSFVDRARRCATFVRNELRRPSGKLLHRYRDGEAAIEGLLDDYAFLIWGLIELYQADHDDGWLEWAEELADLLRERFWIEEHKAFFLSTRGDEDLPLRMAETHDGAIPSGNSVSLYALLKLARLADRGDLEKLAREGLGALTEKAASFAQQHTFLMCGLEEMLGPRRNVVVVGDPNSPDTRALLDEVDHHYIPDATVLVQSPTGKRKGGHGLQRTGPHRQVHGKATAYLCTSTACLPPATDTNTLKHQLLSGV